MSPDPTKKKRPTFGQNVFSLALYLVELILPALLSVGIVAWLFTYYKLWAWGPVLAIVVYVLAVILLSFMITVGLDTLTAGGRAARSVIGGGPIARLVKYVLAGLLLPIALAISANLISLPTGGTLLDLVGNLAQPPAMTTPPDEVARAVQAATDPTVKRTGIEVLVKFKSPEALDQLMRLANEDRAALRDGATARALSQALAAYGSQAREALLAMFNSVDPAESGGALADDLYGRYFTTAFDALEAEVRTLHPDQLARVEAARAALQSALADLHNASTNGAEGDPRPLFVLQTFQAMNLSTDKDLLAFAVKTAADARYPAAVRGEALLLVGKLGQEAELTGLYPYLKNPDAFLQMRALQAVSAILSKKTPDPK
jgi:HEAT repeat protein